MQPPRGWGPLHDAVLALDIQQARELLEAGANPNAATEQGLTPCMLVCMPFLQTCTPGSFGCTPLRTWLTRCSQEADASHAADANEQPAFQKRLQLLQLLLGAGADPQAGFTPTGQPTAVPASDRTRSGFALVLAAAAGSIEVLEVVLPTASAATEGPGPTTGAAAPPASDGGSNSSSCAGSNHLAHISGTGADMPPDSPVAWAVVGQRAAAVRWLIERGYRLAPCLEGAALGMAALWKQADIVEALLQSGVSPSVRYQGSTPLHMACMPLPNDEPRPLPWHAGYCSWTDRQLRVVRLLRAAATDAEVEAWDEHGLTPLLVCAHQQQEQAAVLLQELGADIHATGRDGKGVLEAAWGSGTLSLLLTPIKSGCAWQAGAEVEEWMPAVTQYGGTMEGVKALLQQLLLLADTLWKAVQAADQPKAAACCRLLELLQPACSADNAWWYESSIPHRAIRSSVLATTWRVVTDQQQLQQLMQLFGEMHVPHPWFQRTNADKLHQEQQEQQQRAEDPDEFLQEVCCQLPAYLLDPSAVWPGIWGVYKTVLFPNPTLLQALLMLGADASHAIDASGRRNYTPLAWCMPAWYEDLVPTRYTRLDGQPYDLPAMLPLIRLLVAHGASVAERMPGKYVANFQQALTKEAAGSTVWRAALRQGDPQLLMALLQGAGQASRQAATENLTHAAMAGKAGTLRLVLGLQLPWLQEHAEVLLLASMYKLEHPQAVKAVIKWLVRLGGQEDLLASTFRKLSLAEPGLLSGPEDSRLAAAATLFLEAGVDINTPDQEGNTPLLLAVTHEHHHYAKWLLDRGADASAVDSEGKGIWALAAEVGVNMVASLMARGFALPEGSVEHLVQLLQAAGMKDTQLVHAERQLQQVLKANEKKVEKRQKRKEAPKAPAVTTAMLCEDPAAAAEAAAAALLAAEEAEAAAKAAKKAAQKAAKKLQQQQQQQQQPQQGSGQEPTPPGTTDGSGGAATGAAAAAAAGGGGGGRGGGGDGAADVSSLAGALDALPPSATHREVGPYHSSSSSSQPCALQVAGSSGVEAGGATRSCNGASSSVHHVPVQAPRDDVLAAAAPAAAGPAGGSVNTHNTSSRSSSSGGSGGVGRSSSGGGAGSSSSTTTTSARRVQQVGINPTRSTAAAGAGHSTSSGSAVPAGGPTSVPAAAPAADPRAPGGALPAGTCAGGAVTPAVAAAAGVPAAASSGSSSNRAPVPLQCQDMAMGWAGAVASSSSSRQQDAAGDSQRQGTGSASTSSVGHHSTSRQRNSSRGGAGAGAGGHNTALVAASHGAPSSQQQPVPSSATASSLAAAAAAANQAADHGLAHQGPPESATATTAAAAAAVSSAPQPSVGVQQLLPLGGLVQGSLGRATRIKECVVCLDARSCVLMLPCLHIVMCEPCSQLLIGRGQLECPLDRSLTAARVVLPY